MSKIKDLYAIESGIDDLMPVEDHIGDYERKLHDNILANIKDVKDDIARNAQYTSGTDDEGHEETYFENFYGLCHSIAEEYLGSLIEDQHLDLSDDDYDNLKTWVGDWLADELADYESECINDFIEYNNDKAEAYREYNRLTLGG